MKTPIPILLILSLLVSCSTNTGKFDKNVVLNDTSRSSALKPDNLADDTNRIEPPQIVTDNNEMQIISLNDTLYLGDTLTIHFKVPHFKDLAITTPDDKFYFLIYAQSQPDKPSLIDWDVFSNQKSISIITSKTKANPWDARIKSNQLIFDKPGIYQIKLSENLETDDGTPVEIREVYFFDKQRGN